MSSYQHIPTHFIPTYLPSSTYLPVLIPKYQYIFAADRGANISLVSTAMTSLTDISNRAKRTYGDYVKCVVGIEPTEDIYAEIGITIIILVIVHTSQGKLRSMPFEVLAASNPSHYIFIALAHGFYLY